MAAYAVIIYSQRSILRTVFLALVYRIWYENGRQAKGIDKRARAKIPSGCLAFYLPLYSSRWLLCR